MNEPEFIISTPVPSNAWLTLRDYFAAHCPPSSMNDLHIQFMNEEKTYSGAYMAMAKLAYIYADAMLEARKNK